MSSDNFIMSGDFITGNTTTGADAGVAVSSGPKTLSETTALTMRGGGTITENESNNGAGVGINGSYAAFIMGNTDRRHPEHQRQYSN